MYDLKNCTVEKVNNYKGFVLVESKTMLCSYQYYITRNQWVAKPNQKPHPPTIKNQYWNSLSKSIFLHSFINLLIHFFISFSLYPFINSYLYPFTYLTLYHIKSLKSICPSIFITISLYHIKLLSSYLFISSSLY